MPKDQAIKKQLKRAQLELAEQDKENMVVANAKQQLEGAQAAGSSCHTIQSCLEQLRECEADEAPALLQKLTVTLKLGDDERVYGRSAGAIPLLCQQTYTSAAAYALPALYELSLNQRNLELLAARKGFVGVSRGRAQGVRGEGVGHANETMQEFEFGSFALLGYSDIFGESSSQPDSRQHGPKMNDPTSASSTCMQP